MREASDFINREALGSMGMGLEPAPYVPVVPHVHTTLTPAPSVTEIDPDMLHKSVLIVYNDGQSHSVNIKDYYLSQRGPYARASNRFLAFDTYAWSFGNQNYRQDGSISAVVPDVASNELYVLNDIVSYWATMNPKPGYIILSKDCPLMVTVPFTGVMTVESYLFQKAFHETGCFVSITRLEGRTDQNVKDIIDRSVESDTYDMSDTARVVNAIGYAPYTGRVIDAAQSCRLIPELKDTITHVEGDNPEVLEIPITKETIFYADLSGVYLKLVSESGARNRVGVIADNPVIVDQKYVDTIPQPYSLAGLAWNWDWDNRYLRVIFHDGEYLEDIVIQGTAFPLEVNDEFTFSDVPILDYQAGDCVEFKKNGSEFGGEYVRYNSETGVLTLKAYHSANVKSGDEPYHVGSKWAMSHRRRYLIGTDVELSDDYTQPQTVTWLNNCRPTDRGEEGDFYLLCDKLVDIVLSRYEQIKFAPGAYVFNMNSACGSSQGITSLTRFQRDLWFTIYSQMNRADGATLSLGSPTEPSSVGLGSSRHVMLFLACGHNFGFATIPATLTSNPLINIIGDPLCAPHASKPLVTFEIILRNEPDTTMMIQASLDAYSAII